MSEEYYERLVDEDALGDYLREHLGDVDEYAVERHQEGHSNETLFVTWGDRELVVRRPPPGETAETAHDVLREYRVTAALTETAVPVPEPILACDDPDVIGSDFYVMDRLEGTVMRESESGAFADLESRRRIGEELVDTLAAIHDVDYEAVGLADFGHPPSYTERQVERWGQQLMWAFDVTTEEREVPDIYDVGAWLQENAPEDHPHTLVHGDYKLDNVMYATDDGAPELVGVFDWEMATLGDPRADLGWLLSYWRDPKDPEPAVPELTATFMEREGYSTRRELVDRWESRTDFSFEHDRFYRALAVYKLAALGEMFFRRYLEGNSDDPMYPLMEDRVPALATRAKRIVDGDEPL
ncbi:phosphotransferase family protein [Natronobacterium gregoryi]|uniref:Aminoglycoside phosphotransferase n=2 Tax=Natronobacterium gregoryi TaxID=44930 RepID=L0AHH1_NATGS|nr:phosphotransferase family protein [Natronobacterium gregoryi]AFZ73246.1 putative aminoglycoside phosphotransferase [Natronobacterium gregoryi SP2]ELY71295.1 aminoglycoside phosphotransferase [Natronobacterium gregoryi SP2]PLK21653.1 phosphotransferase family protein [Natronobacterium gregoryi SP2]SFI57570.1 Predicted kinase, aminoglycoside phosphotransferase (APT) family [Natronobacterium gregoryi]